MLIHEAGKIQLEVDPFFIHEEMLTEAINTQFLATFGGNFFLHDRQITSTATI